MNVCTQIGRLGKDPEGFQYSGDKQGCRFSLAVNNPYGEKDEEGKPKPDWFQVTCFGQSADFTLERLRKGDLAAVVGDIHLGEWKKQDGTTGYSLDLIASRVEAIGPKQDGAAPQQGKPKPAQEPDTAWVDEEEDPFGDQ
jgi:single-strand DNA-binding protein